MNCLPRRVYIWLWLSTKERQASPPWGLTGLCHMTGCFPKIEKHHIKVPGFQNSFWKKILLENKHQIWKMQVSESDKNWAINGLGGGASSHTPYWYNSPISNIFILFLTSWGFWVCNFWCHYWSSEFPYVHFLSWGALLILVNLLQLCTMQPMYWNKRAVGLLLQHICHSEYPSLAPWVSLLLSALLEAKSVG